MKHAGYKVTTKRSTCHRNTSAKCEHIILKQRRTRSGRDQMTLINDQIIGSYAGANVKSTNGGVAAATGNAGAGRLWRHYHGRSPAVQQSVHNAYRDVCDAWRFILCVVPIWKKCNGVKRKRR
jgi:hypothetical protein